MTYEILKTTEQDGILIVTISRPKALNAVNPQFFTEMDDLIASVSKRLAPHNAGTDVKVMVITGEGKAFVSGSDISVMVNMTPAEAKAYSEKGHKTLNNLENLEIPVIAAVNGFALGSGCEIAMACDICIASNTAKFGQPEVNLGLIPGHAGTQRLARIVGLNNALYLLLTADLISADEAYRRGLVQKVVEPEKLLEEATTIAKKIASKGPQAIRLVKKVTRQGLLSDFNTGCSLEAEYFSSLFGNEGTEGMRAFLEKRQPKW